MRTYKPKRASARWLEGAPDFVLSCHDNGGKTADRYTVFFGGSCAYPPSDYRGYDATGPGNTMVPNLAMSENPFHPQGVGMSGDIRASDRASWMYTHNGRKCRWLDLPEQVRKCVLDYAKWEDKN